MEVPPALAQLQRYRVVRELGHGGSSDVMLVEDAGSEPRLKALKLLRANIAPKLVTTFRQEFRILATLEHPALARVYDFGELADGRAYYTCEFVEGSRLDQQGGTWREVCRAMAAVCRALAYLHTRGYVHNDLKPANIVLADTPESAKLLDFGLASIDAASRERVVYGTPGYLAPERLAGETWDARADLYAVGATLYRLLAARHVTEHESPGDALADLRAHAPDLAAERPDLPKALCDLVHRLLAFDVQARPKHAFEIVEGLGRALGEVLPLETAGAARCYALSSVLVGRDAVMADLARGIREAFAGGSRRMLVVAAGAGLGKTRVLRQVVGDEEMRGVRTARSRCDAAADETLARAAASAGLRLGARDDDAIVESFCQAARASKKGLVVAFDDLHAAPERIWRVVRELTRRASATKTPLVLLASVNGDELPVSSRQALAVAVAAGEASRIELAPLTGGELERMLTSLFGEGVIPRDLQDDIARRSGGNPLLLEEIVRELVDQGALRSTQAGWTAGEPTSAARARSERLEDFIRRRCAGLAEPARTTLAALAALGGAAQIEAVRAVAGETLDVELGLALLAERALVTFRATGRAAIEHEVTRAAALGLLGASERTAMHRAAAEWLDANGGSAIAAGRAWREAGDAKRAWDRLCQAGEGALAAGEVRLAVGLLEEALALEVDATPLERARVLAAFSKACAHVGRRDDAIDAGLRACDALPNGARPQRLEYAVETALHASMEARRDDVERCFSRAREALDRNDHRGAALFAYGEAFVAHWMDGDLARSRRKVEDARRELASAAPDDELSLRVTLLSGARELVTDFARAVDVHREVAERIEQSPDRSLFSVTLNNFGYALFQQRKLAEARSVLTRACDEAERLGNLRITPIVLSNLADTAHFAGDWTQAREHLRRATLVAAQLGSALPFATLARIAWMEDDAATAARLARAVVDGEHGAFRGAPPARLYIAAAAAAADLGDLAALDRYVGHAEALARERNWPVIVTSLEVVRAYRAALNGGADAARRLVAAAEALEAIGAASDAVYVKRDAVKWLATSGDVAGARTLLERVRRAHIDVGCVAGAAQVDGLAARFGGKVEPAAIRRAPPQVATLLERAARAAGLDVSLSLQTSADQAEGARVLDAGAFRLVARGGEGVPEQTFALLAAVARELGEPSTNRADAATTAVGRPRERGDDESRAFELTLGPVELRSAFEGVVGKSSPIQRALALLDRLATSDAPVLLTGETGTGKEVFARALHLASSRSARPFVVANCAAIPHTLFEAELFGHRRSAFTGAVRDHAGYVRDAEGGTIFLDEIGELPLELQPKLLRLLQDRRVWPVGADAEQIADVRIVAATNRDLEQEVAAGRFRADLFFRLNVADVHLPPLRDRASDVAPLAKHFLEKLGSTQELTTKAMRALMAYAWPGNVRELENVVHRASLLAGGGRIESRHLPARVRAGATSKTASGLAEKKRASEREAIEAALRATGNNLTHAAKQLGLTRQGLQFKLKQLGIERAKKR
ncbi:MAG TPA: sigma 54-interacting transcriptional regulator [Polyangiaceae bacterium]